MTRLGDTFNTKVIVYTENLEIKTTIIVNCYLGTYTNLIKSSICIFRHILKNDTYKLNTNSYD